MGIIKQLLEFHNDYLVKLTSVEILDRIDKLSNIFSNENHPLFKETLEALNYFPSKMIKMVLLHWAQGINKSNVKKKLDSVFDKPAIAVPPKLVTFFIAGNIPLLAWESVIIGLLLNAAIVLKVPDNNYNWHLPFLKALNLVDDKLMNGILITKYSYDQNSQLYDDIIYNSDAIVAYGSNKTMKYLSSKVPWYKKFLPFGNKVSLAIITNPNELPQKAKKLAYDMWIYFQQGCLSLQTIYFINSNAKIIKEFSNLLTKYLDMIYTEIPQFPLTTEEANQINMDRDVALFEEGCNVYSCDKLRWTIITSHKTEFKFFAGKCITNIMNVESLNTLSDILAPYQHYIQAIAIDQNPQTNIKLYNFFKSMKISRICEPGKLQFPQFLWHNEGFDMLDNLIHWTDCKF